LFVPTQRLADLDVIVAMHLAKFGTSYRCGTGNKAAASCSSNTATGQARMVLLDAVFGWATWVGSVLNPQCCA
jgi:hypothetical protein